MRKNWTPARFNVKLTTALPTQLWIGITAEDFCRFEFRINGKRHIQLTERKEQDYVSEEAT
jgi:hypothetical protein